MIKGSGVMIQRGDIVFVELIDCNGKEQKGGHPAVIISNSKACEYSPVVNVVTFTSKLGKKELPTHKTIEPDAYNKFRTKSVALCEQVITLDKNKIKFKIGELTMDNMNKILDGVRVQFAM